MIRYDDNLNQLLLHVLRGYGCFEVMNIFNEDQFINVHVVTEEGYSFTVVFSFTEDYMDYEYVGIYRGFIKHVEQKEKELSVRELTWLKRDFDEEAYKCLNRMKELDDFSHLEYTLDECGAYYSVKMLSESRRPEELIKLSNCGRLDLSLENLALQKKYQPLFSHRELMICYKRLKYFGNIAAAKRAAAAQTLIHRRTAHQRGYMHLVKAG